MRATPRHEAEQPEIHYTPIGDAGRPARIELVGLLAYSVSLTAFLTWLIAFGVNV